ncbi:PTS galactitol transporter subunit IIC [Pectinatus frisingensis]|uniref:PTS galactitol transporter subunit IIC n=1 Tax=Pectinatus frisingensis TaxID=865 RepID=UPI0018C7044C|nr:PTS transporter subunit IIC [Pectinatus frisingensis]
MVFAIFKHIISAGPTLMLPIVIFIFAILLRLNIGKAIQSAVTMGAAFAGLKLIINFMATNLGPATKAMVTHLGIHLNIIDMGFGTLGAIGWSSPIVPLMVFSIFFVNILLLISNKTNTLSVDIWNYHHGLTIGALIFFESGNVLLSVGSAVCLEIFVFKLSDWAAPLVHNYFKIPSVTVPALHPLTNLPIAVPLNWIIDRIPVFNKIDFNMESLRKYFGVFGQPLMIGLILGLCIGLASGYDLYKAFGLGINMSTVMMLLPKVMQFFVEGLKPISAQAKKVTDKYFKGRKILIGLDPSILLGDPAVITTSLLMVPILLALAVILPNNNFLPFADLAALGYKVSLIVALTRGNIFRSLIISTIVFVPYFYFATWTAWLVTAVAQSVGLGSSIPSGMMISSFVGPTMPISFLVLKVFMGNIWLTLPILLITFIACWIFVEKKIMPNIHYDED